jgi:lysyl-tRNA synthetase, class II
MTTRPAQTRPSRSPRLAAAAVAFAGMVNLVSVAVPVERARLRLLAGLVPGALVTTATAATAASGVGLLLLSGGLRRRRRSALVATVVLLLSGAVFHLLKGLDLALALVEAFLGGLLVGKADRFGARAGLHERRPVLRPAVAVVGLTLGVGLLGLLVNRRDVDGSLTVASGLWEVARLAVGLSGPLGLDGWFGRVFPVTVMVMFMVGGGLVVLRLLGPALTRGRPADPELPALAARSDDSLAHFALRDDRSSVRSGEGVVSYGTVGTVALAAGDPLGPPGQWPQVAAAFLAEAARQGRVAAVMGCGQAAAHVYEQAGLVTIYMGDEAVLDLDGFTLQGRVVRIARQSWHRARRAGLTCQVWQAGDLDPATIAELWALSRRWRGDAAERGFSMALGRLFDPRDQGAYVVAARDGAGRLLGFLHFVPWGSDGASLDVMRRDRQAPAILNDYLVVEAARRLPALGVRRMSLNFSFLRGVLVAGAEPDAPWGLRLERWTLRRLSGWFQIETLYRFNKKFAPSWVPRYLAVEAIEDLPRVALGALRLEGLFAPPRRRDHRERTDHDAATPDRDAPPAQVARSGDTDKRRRTGRLPGLAGRAWGVRGPRAGG